MKYVHFIHDVKKYGLFFIFYQNYEGSLKLEFFLTRVFKNDGVLMQPSPAPLEYLFLPILTTA